MGTQAKYVQGNITYSISEKISYDPEDCRKSNSISNCSCHLIFQYVLFVLHRCWNWSAVVLFFLTYLSACLLLNSLLTPRDANYEDLYVPHNVKKVILGEDEIDTKLPISKKKSQKAKQWYSHKKPSELKIYSKSIQKSFKFISEFTSKKRYNETLSKKLEQQLFSNWKNTSTSYCNGIFVGYSNEFALLKYTLFHKSKALAKGKGGESVTSVLNRPTADEYYTYSKGVFTVPCTDAMRYPFDTHISQHILDWHRNLDSCQPCMLPKDSNNNLTVIKGITLALTRYEYANVYWTLMDLYDIFLMKSFFQSVSSNTTIFLLDAKATGHLDGLWHTLYGSILKPPDLPQLTRFQTLIWALPRSHSPFKGFSTTIPFLRDFKTFVLQKHSIRVVPKQRYCKARNLSILYIWRRNYIAHPRNPTGSIKRKIRNEIELLNATKSAFPSFQVRGAQLDLLNMTEQLILISHTDILIGMHGAAFAFSIFMPSGGGVIEFFPMNALSNWHMKSLALANNLFYSKWQNTDIKNENFMKKSTRVPPDIATRLLYDMIQDICSNVKSTNFPNGIHI